MKITKRTGYIIVAILWALVGVVSISSPATPEIVREPLFFIAVALVALSIIRIHQLSTEGVAQ